MRSSAGTAQTASLRGCTSQRLGAWRAGVTGPGIGGAGSGVKGEAASFHFGAAGVLPRGA